ncbi:rhodanese-like domain-containing protein [Desulfitobacterium sp.]|uniref:rhodanese-like domain-containing protein n=1 Tax=Desulfitobacterium sp. TaxID=49981 RepID=UPI002C00AE2D|nr:rhodanese-like domain-containing protein [Desulfitobacterium sp.]HVJ47607.1 rhodanese-like domain-containing protein [Desulfitobacterium sp.]
MKKTVWGKEDCKTTKIWIVFPLILGISLFLSGCGTQPETKEQGKENSGTPPIEQSLVSQPEETSSLSPESMISASQLDAGIKDNKNWAVIDVREPNEFATGHVPTSFNIPLGKLEQSLNQVPKDKELILVCLNGTRAFTAWQNLINVGYDPYKVKVLVGGMEQWKSLGSDEVTDSIGGC